MEQNYFLQSYNQVVDLYNLTNGARKSVCEIEAEEPFLCNFVSQDDLTRLGSDIPMDMVQKTSLPVTPENRYIVMKSLNGKPTRVSIREKFTPTPIRINNYSREFTAKQFMWWIFIILAVLAIIGGVWWFMKKNKGKNFKSPFSQAIDTYKQTGSFTGAMRAGGKAVSGNINDAEFL